MRSYCLALAALATVGLSGAAFAGTAPKAMSDNERAPSIAAKQMTDAEMDGVAAGKSDIPSFFNFGLGPNNHQHIPLQAQSNGFQGQNFHAAKFEFQP
jgi:hypothetical protein